MLLALRASVRTKVVVFLVLLQILCALVLPRIVKGDGTPAGDLQILLTYTLGFSFGLQALSTLWSSCSLFAGEISNFQIQLSLVKPVRYVTFWFGKWLALLVLNAALLIFIYTIVYVQVRWVERSEGWNFGVVPSSLHVARPILPTPEEEALQVYENLEASNSLPEDLSKKMTLAALEEQASERYDIINPGDEVKLKYHLIRSVKKGESLIVRLNFDTEYSTRAHFKGVCRLMLEDNQEIFMESTLDSVTQNEIRLTYGSDEFIEKSTEGDSLRDFVVSFKFTGDDDKASALLMRFRQDAALLIPGGIFETNLMRSALVQGSVLALLAAFGLTLSAVFSFPVAAFAATVVLALIMIGGGVLPLVSKEDEQQWQNRVGVMVLRSAQYTTRHISDIAPLHSVVKSDRISDYSILISVFWNMGLMPLALAILACAALSRRELADV
jgi:ABC-type transport system involved in multi-copper enzyme maturation permease subunit